MGKVTRKRYSCEFKSRVALEAIRGEQTLAELASKHGVHQTMIAQWKRQAIEGMSATFSGKQAAEATISPIFAWRNSTRRSGSSWWNGIFYGMPLCGWACSEAAND